MSRTRTLAELRADIADRLDVPPFGPNTFVSATTIDRWINQSVRRYMDLLVGAYGEHYFRAEETINAVAGTARYAIPADYFETIYMRVIIDGITYNLERADIDQIDHDPSTNYGWSRGYPPRYRIIGGFVNFTPTPTGPQDVLHVYLPTTFVADNVGAAKTELTADDDVLEGWNGWEEHVVLDVCRKHSVTEERDPTPFIMEMAEYAKEIKERARLRDNTQPKRVRNVYDRRYGW